MTYEPRIEKGVEGPAWIIVPISESEVDRAVFNACARVRLGDRLVQTPAELDDVHEYQMLKGSLVRKALKSFGLIDTRKTEDLKRLEDHVYDVLTGKKVAPSTPRRVSDKAAQLSSALRDAGFTDTQAYKSRTYRALRAGAKELPHFPMHEESRGYFTKYSDPRARGRKRFKYEVRTSSEEDALEAQEIAQRIVPEAYVMLHPNKLGVTITWTE